MTCEALCMQLFDKIRSQTHTQVRKRVPIRLGGKLWWGLDGVWTSIHAKRRGLYLFLTLILTACDMHAPSRFIRTADAELLRYCDQAAERWYDATGIQVECTDMHMPTVVTLRWGVPTSRCATGSTNFDEILVRPEAPPEGCGGYGLEWDEAMVVSIITHEMGHIMAGRGAGHAEDGIMARVRPRDAPINQATLDWLCATAECEWEEAE